MRAAPTTIPRVRGWALAVFVAVLLAELVGAYIIVYKWGYVNSDAMARTANAYYVLYLLPNKLASLGFVWNPLTSFLQIPILLFAHVWRPLATAGLAGSIVTAVFAGINASCLFRYLCMRKCSIWVALLIVALYAFNPFIFLYGFNGMSETLFFTVLIVSVHNFTLWMEDRVTARLLAVALMLAVGFLTRYETAALILGFAAALFVAIYLMKDSQSPFTNKPIKMKVDYGIATYMVVFIPVAYVICIWIIMCWTITGDPLYFASSVHSNESQSAVVLSANYLAMVRDPLKALKYTAIHVLPFILVFAVIVCERIMTKRIFKLDMLVLLFLGGCFVCFEYFRLLTGGSTGWFRYFSFIHPVSVAWFPYELGKLTKKTRALASAGLCGALIVSSILMPIYFSDHNLAGEENALFYEKNSYLEPQFDMAKRINEKYGDATILLDSFATSSLILTLDHPEKIITSISDDFMEAMATPYDHGIDYILVPLPKALGLLDAVNNKYPNLYHYGVPSWAHLVESNAGMRLYEVKQKDESRGQGDIEEDDEDQSSAKTE